MAKQKTTNFHELVNNLRVKYALSNQVRDEIMKIVRKAYAEGGTNAIK